MNAPVMMLWSRVNAILRNGRDRASQVRIAQQLDVNGWPERSTSKADLCTDGSDGSAVEGG